jgi:hypothetical protein
MRVSPDFNKMVAPLLYREVTLVNSTPSLLKEHPNGHLLSMPVYIGPKENRLVAGKASDMGHIRHVTVEEGDGCFSDAAVKLFIHDYVSAGQISSLRFTRRASRSSSRIQYDSHPLLGLWYDFRPTKIIIHDAGPRETLRFPIPDGLECLVIRFNWIPASVMYNYARKCQTLKKIVYVIPVPVLWPDRMMSESRRREWTPMVDSLRILAQDEETQCEIVIVDSEGSSEEMEQRQEMIEARIKTTYEGGGYVPYKGPVKTIQFLSLFEYVSTHDWSGEEEVRPWTCLM